MKEFIDETKNIIAESPAVGIFLLAVLLIMVLIIVSIVKAIHKSAIRSKERKKEEKQERIKRSDKSRGYFQRGLESQFQFGTIDSKYKDWLMAEPFDPCRNKTVSVIKKMAFISIWILLLLLNILSKNRIIAIDWIDGKEKGFILVLLFFCAIPFYEYILHQIPENVFLKYIWFQPKKKVLKSYGWVTSRRLSNDEPYIETVKEYEEVNVGDPYVEIVTDDLVFRKTFGGNGLFGIPAIIVFVEPIAGYKIADLGGGFYGVFCGIVVIEIIACIVLIALAIRWVIKYIDAGVESKGAIVGKIISIWTINAIIFFVIRNNFAAIDFFIQKITS